MTDRPRRDATPAEIAEVLARSGERFVVTSHHNPDGDAIGSMLGLTRALRAAGHDVVMAHADDPPVPGDLAFLMADDEVIVQELPADLGERVLVAVNCASELRMWHDPGPRGRAGGDRHRPPPGQHPLRRPQPDRAARLQHGGGRLERPRAGRLDDHPGDRRAALRRA